MKVIGLTGGIGAGKSTVSDYLTELGYLILDADQMSREMTAKGSPVLKKIANLFGEHLILTDGNLDRKGLAAIIFSDKEKKLQLEEITTKEVVRNIGRNIEDLKKSGECDIVFVDAPLLFESGADQLTDLVWMVTAEDDIRIARVMNRDGASRDEVLQRIANQMSNEEKIRRSQEIIDNSKGKEDLYHQIDDLLKKYGK